MMTANASIPPNPPPTPADLGRQEITSELQTENLIETYQIIAEWIRFADAKAAVVLTAGAAAAGLLTPTLKEYRSVPATQHLTEWWSQLVLALFSVWLFLLVASLAYAFWCLLPFRRASKRERRVEHPARTHCPHFHAVGIAAKYPIDAYEEFVAGYRQAALGGFQREVLAGLLIDSHISVTKYARVTRAIYLFAYSMLVALAYLVAIQF